MNIFKVIIGLGNPCEKYRNNRHNLGFIVIDAISKKWALPLNKKKHQSKFACGKFNNKKIIILKPTTFMNNSGIAVNSLVHTYALSISDILVVCDDFQIPLGNIRIRKKGSSGGHKGLESIIFSLGNSEFTRIRVGIGPLPDGIDPADFVLTNFKKNENKILNKTIENIVEAIESILINGIDSAMNKFNEKVSPCQ